MALQKDGKILIAGYEYANNRGSLLVARYTTGGVLDTTFGGQGKVVIGGANGASYYGSSIAVQEDGKILAGGYMNLIDHRISVTRFTESGAVDRTFGNGGAAVLSFSDTSYLTDLVLQEDGKILVVGRTSLNGKEHLLIARFTSQGGLDGSFGSQGKVTIGRSVDFYADRVVLQSDGKILVAGKVGTTSLGIARFTENGVLDQTFGTQGWATTSLGNDSGDQSLAIQEDGKIVAVGTNGGDFIIVRFTTAGVLDSSFGTAGKVVSNFGGYEVASNVAIQSDGKILVGGGDRLGLVLACYLPTGGLDPSFGSGGRVSTPLEYTVYNYYCDRMFVQKDGQILLAGSRPDSMVTHLVRYESTTQNTLTSLTLGQGTLSPAFSRGTTEYTSSVLFSVETMTVTPTVFREQATIEARINGGVFGPIVSGTATGELALNVGSNLIEVKVTGPRGDVRVYTIAVTRLSAEESADASLASLSLEAGELNPPFTAPTESYTAMVGHAQESMTLAATTTQTLSTIEVKANSGEYSPLASGETSHALGLNVGANAIVVKVTAPDGTTSKTYTVTVTRTVADKTKPTIKITAPGSTVKGAFTASGTVKEIVGLASLKWRLNQGPWTEVTTVGTIQLNGGPLIEVPLPQIGNAITWGVENLQPENGQNTFSVMATDCNGNLSQTTKSFTYVNPEVADLAGIYHAVLRPVVPSDVECAGWVYLTVAKTGTFTGKLVIGGVSQTIQGVVGNDRRVRFKPSYGHVLEVLRWFEWGEWIGQLTLRVTEANGLIAEVANGEGDVLADGAGEIAPYGTKNLVPAAPYLNQPVAKPTKGVFNVVFGQTSPDADAPAGFGYAVVTLSKTGTVSLSGKLSDGMKFSAASKLRSDRTAPIFTLLYGNKGGFGGDLHFVDEADLDVKSNEFLWVRPPQPNAAYYWEGWPSGLMLDRIFGTHYAAPASLNFGQGDVDLVNGNAGLHFREGGLTVEVDKTVSLSPVNGQVKLIPPTGADYQFKFTASSGLFTGSFTRSGQTRPFEGVLLNKGGRKGGYGFFLSKPERQSGAVYLTPDGL